MLNVIEKHDDGTIKSNHPSRSNFRRYKVANGFYSRYSPYLLTPSRYRIAAATPPF